MNQNFNIDQQEIWKDIKGFEGRYQVSSMGRVKSLKYGKERILRPCKNSKGYLQVVLYKDGKGKRCYVHRLVAQTFIPNPLNLSIINHKDERVDNNMADNLEFCTAKYNNNYGTHNMKISKPVLQLTLDGKLVREWPSTKEAERLGGFNNSAISHCCSGRHKTHKGYIWKYKEAG